MIEEYKSNSDYDILIPVSGGKDSYFQTHFAIHEDRIPWMTDYVLQVIKESYPSLEIPNRK